MGVFRQIRYPSGMQIVQAIFSSWRVRATLMLLATIPFGACNCSEPPLAQLDVENVCNPASVDCPGNDEFKNGECSLGGCDTDADCCPGTRCRLDFNACVPHQLDAEYACEVDADCEDPAQRCLEVTLGDREPILACSYESCTGDSDCGDGRSCYEDICVQTAPCDGSCPEGEVCDIATSQCHPVPEGAPGCSEPCDGRLRVLRDPESMSGDVCCEIACDCQGLPPIVALNFGKYNDIFTTSTEVLVSAYDSQYGDLVVASYTLEGARNTVEYVDGLALGSPVVADAAGPRGGVAEPGPNVGTHTSITANAEGLARVAYHDVDTGSLKVAVEGAEGFTSHTVEDGDGRIGTYTDIGIDAQGNIVVSYLVEDVTGAPGIAGPASGVKIARSTTPNPQSAADWALDFLDARAAFAPCGQCGAGSQCVQGDEGPTCAPEATTCEEECRSTQSCVTLAGVTSCLAAGIPPSVSDYPKARGLHTNLLVDGNDTVVVYYDSIDGDLRAAQIQNGGSANVSVIDGDGQDSARDSDAGRFPAITKVGTEYVVVYTDFSFHQVRAWSGATLGTGGTFRIIDNGKVTGSPGQRFVGAGASIASVSGGAPIAVYQDATTLDLKSAALTGTDWTTTVLPDLEPGAHGFFSKVALSGSTIYITSVLAEVDGRGLERVRLGLTLRTAP